jgi:hypothetical protein
MFEKWKAAFEKRKSAKLAAEEQRKAARLAALGQRKAAKLAAEEQRRAAAAEAEKRRQAIESIRARAAQLSATEGVLAKPWEDLLDFVSESRVEWSSIPDVLTELVVGPARGGAFLAQPDATLVLKNGENALLEVSAELLKEVTDRQFQGGSQGVSVPVGHGVRYRTGAVRGHMVTIGTHWASADAGRLTVTDQRVVYHGGRKTLEFLFTKLATLNLYTDALALGVTNRQTTSLFRTPNPEMVSGVIHGALSHVGTGVTIVGAS